jgi:hypothetical protein
MRARRARRTLVTLGLVLGLSGCMPTGRDFARLSPSTFRLGESSVGQARQVLGDPRDDRSWTRSDNLLQHEGVLRPTPFPVASVSGTLRQLTYGYSWQAGEPATPGVRPSKTLRLWFWNDKLVAYRASSSFKADATDVDEEKVSTVQAWKSLKADVLATFGEPAGIAGYPMTRDPDQQVLIYQGFEWDNAKRQIRSKELYVLVNILGIVEDVRFDGQTRPTPPPTVTPSTTTVPVYIPAPKQRR